MHQTDKEIQSTLYCLCPRDLELFLAVLPELICWCLHIIKAYLTVPETCSIVQSEHQEKKKISV